jgi:hypothetical protein
MSWTESSNGLPRIPWNAEYYRRIFHLVSDGRSIFAGTEVSGIFRSTDGGMNWFPASTGLADSTITDTTIYALAGDGRTLFAARGSDIFCSSDSGASWMSANGNLDRTAVDDFAFCGDAVIVARGHTGVFRSTDNGSSWMPATSGMSVGYVGHLVTKGSNVFAATSHGVYLSTDHGSSWKSVTLGLYGWVSTLGISGTTLFASASTGGYSLWKRPLSQMITTVEPTLSEAPRDFVLEQNYPNPFNPTTTIRYALPERSHVTLTVFNTLGQRIATLVNSDIDAAYHSVQFDAAGLASGVYFYRLSAGSYVDTKQLLLVR